MSASKIAITIDSKLLNWLDKAVAKKLFPNRSKAIQAAVQEKVERMDGSRLEAECAKLVPAEERAMADEGLAEDARQWPVY